eukprot:TRINITY_DN263_c0_g1_i5.p1 TRINITY_DN263_c0_g1~~TRINITY_DN263_c0_g1_i5.p1  ORF type:complete len:402 (+),score=16.19 TRINITY_DN263_c0_g1_i5:105-1208(+)
MARQDLLELVQAHPLSELLVCYLFGKIASAVSYIHQAGYAHRNIKLENIVFTPQGEVKLKDFYLAHPLKPGGIVRGLAGTQFYMGPEIINLRLYSGPAADAFALGVLLFSLAVRCYPFKKAEPTDLRYSLIVTKEYAKYWEFVSTILPTTFPLTNDFKDLVINLLNPTPSARMTVAEALGSKWVTNTSKPNASDAKYYFSITINCPDATEEMIEKFLKENCKVIRFGLYKYQYEGKKYTEAKVPPKGLTDVPSVAPSSQVVDLEHSAKTKPHVTSQAESSFSQPPLMAHPVGIPIPPANVSGGAKQTYIAPPPKPYYPPTPTQTHYEPPRPNYEENDDEAAEYSIEPMSYDKKCQSLSNTSNLLLLV